MRDIGVTGHPARRLGLDEVQPQDHDQEHHLPVREAGPRLGTSNPAVKAEIVEWRESPDLFVVRGKFSELPSGQADYNVQRQHQPCATEYRRQRQQGSASHSSKPARDGAQENNRFEREIASKRALSAEPYPDTERQVESDPLGDRQTERQINLLLDRALFTEQQRLEFDRAHESSSDSRSYAQLHQQVDQDESVFHCQRIDAGCFTKCSTVRYAGGSPIFFTMAR